MSEALARREYLDARRKGCSHSLAIRIVRSRVKHFNDVE